MIEAGAQEWYVTRATHGTDEFALQRQVTRLVDSPYLADVGYRLESAESSCIAVLDAAQRRERLVIELKIDPPEGNLERIRELMQELGDRSGQGGSEREGLLAHRKASGEGRSTELGR